MVFLCIYFSGIIAVKWLKLNNVIKSNEWVDNSDIVHPLTLFNV